MKTTTTLFIVSTLLFASGLVMTVEYFHADHLAHEHDAELEQLHGHCGTVRAAFEMSMVELGSTDPIAQRVAADRIGEAALRSFYDLTLCASPLPDWRPMDTCKLEHDYACLARLARAARDSIHITEGEP